jgi:hypothetical protein
MSRPARWKNRSVIEFAKGGNPIEAIEQRAREIVLKALDEGWSGPPYDPIKLARLLGIAVTASDEVQDARLLPGKISKIEFNPNRPRGRIRFSIAHEIAHTLLPNFAERVRYRNLAQEDDHHTEWEIETLCNIAAAEIVMPVGSFRNLLGRPADINKIMELRRDLDVSAEAILLRFVRLSDQPIVMFCASRVAQESYVIDYAIGSRLCRGIHLAGLRAPRGTALGDCSAIGFTATRTEEWPDVGQVQIGCVGLPAFPGSVSPRVAGFMRPTRAEPTVSLLSHVHGDATQPRGEGPKIVCQIVNDRAVKWAPRGFVAAVRRRWPAAQEDFSSWVTKIPQRERLGKVHLWSLHDVTIASMIAQVGWGPSPTPRIRYSALASCLAEVSRQAKGSGATVHMPRIGTGQAGGSWDVIEELLSDGLLAQGIPTVIYDPPPQSEHLELG